MSSIAPSTSSGTPLGQSFQSNVITEQSKADYTVYLIRNELNDVISVIIEAKHTANSTLCHVLAQLIGYLAAFQILGNTPLAFVLTEKYVQTVIFPFRAESDDHLLINAVALPKVNIFTPDGGVNPLPLQMILTLSKSFGKSPCVRLPEQCRSMSKSQLTDKILTETDQIQAMSAKLQAMEKKLQEEEENKELKERLQKLMKKLNDRGE